MYFLLFSPQPMCDNHDDGETAAIILCNMCGNLCTDCDRFLHLHRRTRSHQRQVSVGRHTFHFISMMGFFLVKWCLIFTSWLLSGVQRGGGSHKGGSP